MTLEFMYSSLVALMNYIQYYDRLNEPWHEAQKTFLFHWSGTEIINNFSKAFIKHLRKIKSHEELPWPEFDHIQSVEKINQIITREHSKASNSRVCLFFCHKALKCVDRSQIYKSCLNHPVQNTSFFSSIKMLYDLNWPVRSEVM